MYILTTKHHFDSAHFLKGYDGKCSNIHGHRWFIEVSVQSEALIEDGCKRGMLVDFHTLKDDLKKECDHFDHKLIMEEGSLKEATEKALEDEGFAMLRLPYRPTSENIAKYFYDYMTECGYLVKEVTCFETPENRATYTE